jgi:non-lysosomal glucosylceramidase
MSKLTKFDRQENHTGRNIPYTDQELFTYQPQKTLTGDHLGEIAFPLGGIGTGCISISGNGQLIDWEIFNRPNKGYRPDYTFFMLYAQAENEDPNFRILEGRLQPPYQGYAHGAQIFKGFGFGPPREFGSGFLRMSECSFTGYFPFCRLDFADETMPVKISTEAWSPFIPLNDEDSSLPVAIFDVTLTNVTEKKVKTTIALGLQNILGFPEIGKSENRWIDEGSHRGIVMTTQRHDQDSPRFGSMALLTPNNDVTYQLNFEETHWFRATESLMDEFGTTGEFMGPKDSLVIPENQAYVAHLGIKAELAPGESVTKTFVLAWLTPNFEKYWGERHVWKTYQGTKWDSAKSVAEYVLENMPKLEGQTRKFANTFFSSTLPTYVLDAVSSQMSILRTPTVTRLTDGTFYGWEGCHINTGCCEGTCTHVWTYAQTIAHLFPKLERGMREADFALDLRESDGHMQFRMELPPGTVAGHGFHAAADGQMGNILRVYREWQLSGDDEWLKKMWSSVKKALEYAWVDWDKDKDGLLEGIHHNTLDIEYHGPETVCGSMYLAALKAGEIMARYVGDNESADEYLKVFESGKKLSDETLFNGEYYYQRVPEGYEVPYQYGQGCICDQVLGQWHARMYGIGDIYDPEHVKSAIASVFRYNFRDNFYNHHNPHRVYAINDDKGLLICTWPKGGRPKRSVTYAFECMIGFEYQVGAHLVYEGFLREGLSVCKAIRDRHDGLKRNPYNEFECGSHYARSMSNYAYLLALSGFRYSAPEKTIYFDPVICKDDFQCFFSVEGAWGIIKQRKTNYGKVITIKVVGGGMEINKVVSGDKVIDDDVMIIVGSDTLEIPIF